MVESENAIRYRTALPGDAEGVAALHARSWRESYRGAFTDAFLDGDLAGERLREWRRRLDDPRQDQFVLLALDGDRLVGFVCIYGDHDPDWGAFIDNLHVIAECKGLGIGRSLMTQAGTWLCLRYPRRRAYLWVLESNRAARSFYERIGGHNAGVSVMETHGSAIVRSCRYVWNDVSELAKPA